MTATGRLWPADRVERRPVSRSGPVRAERAHALRRAGGADRRQHPRVGLDQCPCWSTRRAGIIAGHGRVLAARKLGIAEVPVVVARGWSEAQKRAYVIADNKLALNAGWDEELLRVELADLRGMGADLSLIGFGEDEIAALLADRTEGLTDPDAVPEVPAEPVSRAGDVWVLGRHRLVCGDCTDAAVVGEGAGRRGAAPDGHRPALWRGVRPGVAQPRRPQRHPADRQGRERRPGRLAGSLGAVPRRGRLRVARRPARGHGGREPGGLRLRHPRPDRLGQGPPGARPRPLPLAARALLVRGEGRRPLERRPQADHALADRQPRPGRRDGARHAEAGGVHAPADREQLLARARPSTSRSAAPAPRSSPPR